MCQASVKRVVVLMDTDVPSRLRMLESFVNSVDAESGRDDLADVTTFARWLRDHDRAPATDNLSSADLESAHTLRQYLREVMRRHHDDTGDSHDADWPRLTEPLSVRLRLDAAGDAAFEPDGHGVAGFLAEIAATVVRASATGDWQRMKICSADDCAVAYYDTSKNRSKRWCSMQVCGNRKKTRTYYQRHSTAGADAERPQ